MLYWTAEPTKTDALMEFAYKPELVAAAGTKFDEVVRKIQGRDFNVVKIPERKVCKECDIKGLCSSDGLIKAF